MNPDPCVPTFPVGNFINPIILDPNTITKYITNLPIPPKLIPDKVKSICKSDKHKSFYTVRMEYVIRQLHPNIPPTKLWAYIGDSKKSRHNIASPLIEAERYNPVTVKWINN